MPHAHQAHLPGVAFPIERGTPIRYEHAPGLYTLCYAMGVPVIHEDGVMRVKVPGEGWVDVARVRRRIRPGAEQEAI